MARAVGPPAAARARSGRRGAGEAGDLRIGIGEDRPHLVIVRHRGDDPAGDGRRGKPEARERAVVEQLVALRRAGDGVGQQRRERGQLGRRHHAPEVEQPVEPERPPDRVVGLEREPLRLRLAAEADAELALEQRAVRPAYRRVLRLADPDPRVACRVEKPAGPQREPAVADAHVVVAPEPRGADVVAVEERGVPRVRVHDVTVPLDQQRVRGRHVRRQLLQHEARVVVPRAERGDRHDLDAVRDTGSRGNRVGEQQHPGELHAFARSRQRAQCERVLGRVDRDQRDGGKAEHRGQP